MADGRKSNGRKRRTKESAQAVLDERYGAGEYIILGEWVRSSVPVLTAHSCGYEWRVQHGNVVNRHFCPGCRLTGTSKVPLKLEERIAAKKLQSELDSNQSSDAEQAAEELNHLTTEKPKSEFREGFTPDRVNLSTLQPVVRQIGEMDEVVKQNKLFKSIGW